MMNVDDNIVVVPWKRLKLDVTIKTLSEEEVKIILDRSYNSSGDFQLFVVSRAVYGFVKILKHIKLYSSHYGVKQNELINELFTLVVSVNPPLAMAKVASNNRSISVEEACEQEKVFDDLKRDEVLTLGDRIKSFVLGQDKAVDKIVLATQRASAGLRDPEQPIGCFLLTGPTGVGKTYMAKILAQELIGSDMNLIRIDCSEYQAGHEYAKLIGAPHGYIGFEQGGVLTNAINKHPFSVVLFDEVEKAHEKVYNLLLQIMDEGTLTSNIGKVFSFKDAIVLMSSNLGVEEVDKVSKTMGFGDASVITDDKRIEALDTALKKTFKPEFLNRLDAVSYFMPLSDEEICKKIVVLELNKLLVYLKENKGMAVDYDSKVVDLIYDKGFDVTYGARPLRRAIRKYFANPLSHRILVEDLQKGADLTATAKDGEAIFKEKKCIQKKKE
jgi:ATP-dependent Clp protease ATP-binding subunit ClpC